MEISAIIALDVSFQIALKEMAMRIEGLKLENP